MKVNGTIVPDIKYDVPEHTSIQTEEIGYFYSLEEAREFAEKNEGILTHFSAPVRVEGELYEAAVRYKV